MKKLITIISLLFTAVATVQGQNESRHEFSANLAAGISVIECRSNWNNKNHAGVGFGGGLGYSYFFAPQWSITTGVDFTRHSNQTAFDNIALQYPIITPPGLLQDFYLNADYSNYEETIEMLSINIPLMLQFQTQTKHKFYIAAGGKIGFPLSAKYTANAETVTTTGYSDFTAQTYKDMPIHGFSTYSGVNSSGKLDYRFIYALCAETGIKWDLGKRWSLYTGIYLNYGLNDIRKNKPDEEMIIYNAASPSDYRYNSSLQSQTRGNNIINDVYPISGGVKTKISFR
ncbi:MAG: PorT family protein [Prevotellaceae bacterium]|jgi:hypothetical protein|nr:PorT family protein [Prevotellaceae bacterium]